MKRQILKTYHQLKYRGNIISGNSYVNRNCVLGIQNKIHSASLHDSNISNNCTLEGCNVSKSTIGDFVVIPHGTVVFDSKLAPHVACGFLSHYSLVNIGQYSYCAGNNQIFNSTIGNFCSIAMGVNIGMAEHPINRLSTSSLFYKKGIPGFGKTTENQNTYEEFKKTVIGHDVWIGSGVFVKSGVTIGNGSIIGAGAVVTRDVAPFSVVGGVPAKLIKMRFSPALISKIEQLNWWEKMGEELNMYEELFHTELTLELLDRFL